MTPAPAGTFFNISQYRIIRRSARTVFLRHCFVAKKLEYTKYSRFFASHGDTKFSSCHPPEFYAIAINNSIIHIPCQIIASNTGDNLIRYCGDTRSPSFFDGVIVKYITPAPNSRKFAQKIHIHTALLKLAFHQGVLRFRALPEREFFSHSVSYC